MNSLLEPIKYITKNFGPRIAGTEADHKTIEYIEKEFRKFSSDVQLESFPVVGRSLQYLINFLVWGYFITAICYFILPPLSIGLAIVMLLVYYLARFKDMNLVNLLVKKDETKNVIARFEPTEEKKQIVVFSGHHDSAFHMPLFEKNVGQVALIQNGAILGLAMLVISGIWKTIVFLAQFGGIYELTSLNYTIGSLTISWWILPDIIFLLALLGLVLAFYFKFNMVTKTPLIGANDNLTSVSMLIAIGQYLKENPPKNLDIRLVSFGGEEPGLVGSIYYVKERLDELKNAVNFNFETLGCGKLGIISKEKDNNVTHSDELVKFIQEIGKKAGMELRAIQVHYGNTDAGSFSKKNFKAATISCYGKHDVFDLWHSIEDTVENVDEKLMRDSYNLSVRIIEELEKRNSK
jgi:hypothetical protein